MRNGIVLIAERWKSLISKRLIGVNLCLYGNITSNNRDNCISLGVRNSTGFNSTVSFNDSENCCLSICPTPTLARFSTAKVTFINLNFTSERAVILVKALANLLAHSPSSLISNSGLSFDLFGGNTATGLRHQVDHIKPSGQSSAGFVKDSICSGANLVSAIIAGVGFPSSYSMKQKHFFPHSGHSIRSG